MVRVSLKSGKLLVWAGSAAIANYLDQGTAIIDLNIAPPSSPPQSPAKSTFAITPETSSMLGKHTEKAFETYVSEILRIKAGWAAGEKASWDRDLALFPSEIVRCHMRRASSRGRK
jgi:hypothetical protein